MTTDTPAWTLERAQPAANLDVFGVRVNIVAESADTGGGCVVTRIIAGHGTGAPLHRHAETERFHVLRGCLSVEADGQQAELREGDTVTVAPWVNHRFWNESGEDAEFIAIATPGGHEKFFRDADELSRSRGFNPESAAALCAQHGIELVH